MSARSYGVYAPGPLLRCETAFLFGSLLAFLLAGCGADAGTWREAGTHRWRPLASPSGGGPGFRRVSSGESGLSFTNRLSEERLAENEILANGSGVALGDVDGDGRVDVYLSRLEGPNALYLNQGGWEFEEATERAGVGVRGRPSTSAVLADVDGDGDLDLLVGVLGGENVLLENDGSGRFERVSDPGWSGERGTSTLALADVDGDGDLDLYVTNYRARWARDLFAPGEQDFEDVVRETEDGEYEVREKFEDHFRLRSVEGGLARWEFGEPDGLYLNGGSGRFERVSWTGGRFRRAGGDTLGRVPDEWGLAARFGDVNGDNRPDLYVANDLESPDHFWLNRGGGRFREAGWRVLRKTSGSSMAVDYADVDGDGVTDLFVADMLSRDPVRRKRHVPALQMSAPGPGDVDTVLQASRNTLQRGRGDGTYAEVARYAGVAASEWTWGAMFLDVDLDGREDLLTTNGHVADMLDIDTQRRLAKRRPDPEGIYSMYPPLRVSNLAFRNDSGVRFEEADWGWGRGGDVSHGLAAGDLDGDGDRDVVVNRLRSEVLVLENTSGAPRLSVRLAGPGSNTRGIGARVRLEGASGGVQEKEMAAGGLYLSSSAPELAFAAGVSGGGGQPSDSLRLVVSWRDGERTEVSGVRAGREYEVRHPSVMADSVSRRVSSSSSSGPSVSSSDSAVGPYFERVGLSHEHVEPEFGAELSRQPLLPLRLSRLGPGVGWPDLDGDGWPELVVGGGRGGRLAVWRNAGGELERGGSGAAEAIWDQAGVVGVPSSSGSGSDLLVGRMNYEAGSAESARSRASVVQVRLSGGGERVTERVAVDGGARASTGPLALADVDGGGDLELFVGGRVYPTAYPVPASSRLFRRSSGGGWVRDSANTARLREVGLVSGAVFSDVDADGDPDLVLATEWGPVKLFENEGGELREATGEWGLSGTRGRWNGVTAGDLNGDGRMDLVVTGWGGNTPYGASAERPLQVYYGDFDRNGTLDVLPARRQAEVGGVAPLWGLDVVGPGLPYVRRRTGSFSAYAEATLEEILGAPALERAQRRSAEQLSHLVLWNRGGRFEAEPLPPEAQYAPAFHVGVADFNGDGAEDVFLTQNFFATAPHVARHDAGRSLWLAGDGEGGLEPVPGQVSGVRVYGDPRGAALGDYDRDGRVDLAVSQNGARTLLYRNRRAEPGLRVRLEGPPGNPRGVGARLRVVYRDGSRGPAREIHAGSGYWSQHAPGQVLGLADTADRLQITWPGGSRQEVPLEQDTRRISVPHPDLNTTPGTE